MAAFGAHQNMAAATLFKGRFGERFARHYYERHRHEVFRVITGAPLYFIRALPFVSQFTVRDAEKLLDGESVKLVLFFIFPCIWGRLVAHVLLFKVAPSRQAKGIIFI